MESIALDAGTPDDWVAVGSATLFDEYERKLREIGRKLDPAIVEEDIPRLRRQVQAVCVAGSPPIDPREAIPILTRDPDDDPIVFAALRADVDLLISDDKDVVPDRRFQTYQHEDHRLLAVTFGVLVEDHIDAPWADIDGSWLAVAHERLQVGDAG
jgi:predicted nucleic acid-binding protein